MTCLCIVVAMYVYVDDRFGPRVKKRTSLHGCTPAFQDVSKGAKIMRSMNYVIQVSVDSK